MKLPTTPPFNQSKCALSLSSNASDSTVDLDSLMQAIEEQAGVLHEKDKALHEQNKALHESKNIIEQKSLVIDEQKKRIAMLEEYLRLERARLYGRSSEKDSRQGEIFNEAELADLGNEGQAEPEETENEIDDDKAKKNTAKKGRKPLSPHLPRDQVHLTLTEEEKAGALDTFFTKVKEELDIVPAKVRVIEYLQEKAVFAEQDEYQQEKRVIKKAELPKHPIPKSAVSVTMLAYIIVAKYCDALPLHRQEKIFSRYGGSITRATMANWLIRLSLQLQAIINLMRDHQREGFITQADETRIQVLKETTKSINSDKYMWVTLGGPPGQPAILFDYDPSRRKEVPLRLLEGFTGYLQTDGYSGYTAVSKKEGLTQVGCWDHARRKFKDAQKSEPKSKKPNQKVSKATVALGIIRKLYAIEDKIKQLSAEEKRQKRQALSLPILTDLKDWLDKNITKVVPGSLIHTAMQYAINQWSKLVVYCDHGLINISNAGAENAIRPFTVGRRNWLFADTPKGAQASAIFYSLIESAKANGLEPFEYLCHLLKHLPYADTVEKLEQLMPWAVKNAKS